MIEEIKEPAEPTTPNSGAIPRDKITRTPGIHARCMWVVQAGVMPDVPVTDYMRQWILTSEAFYAKDGERAFIDFRAAAYRYAEEVCHPGHVNWVKVEFIYF